MIAHYMATVDSELCRAVSMDYLIRSSLGLRFIFFFQAEDGIRDYKVTGVQTCALPIFPAIDVPSGHRVSIFAAIREHGRSIGRSLLAVAIRERLESFINIPAVVFPSPHEDRKSVV